MRLWRRVTRAVSGRRLLAYTMIGVGLGYGAVVMDGRRTTSYLLQEGIMPLWVYAVVLFVLGVGLLHTRTRRREPIGRRVAVVALGVAVFVAVTFAVAGGWTALGWLGPLAWGLWGEAVFIDDEIV